MSKPQAAATGSLGGIAATIATILLLGSQLGFVRQDDLKGRDAELYRLRGQVEILIAVVEARP